MSRWVGKSDLFDTIMMQHFRCENGSDKKEDLDKARVYYSDELECFNEFKKKTGGVIYQHQQVIITEQNQILIEKKCSNFKVIEHIKEVEDKRYKDNKKKETTYTYEYYGKEYTSQTYGYYAITDTHIATPDQAYILSYIKNNTGGYPSAVQKSWWSTSANIGAYSSGAYTESAKAYENFVKKIAKNESDVENTNTYVEKTHTYSDGSTVSILFPEVDEDKMKDNFSLDQDEVSVFWDAESQTYLIGPFTVNCVSVGEFGEISNFKIYTECAGKTKEYTIDDLLPHSFKF